MSRISCNVTKDLLPSYLDEICSDESRELVEEHLRECASCREFLAGIKAQELKADSPQIDYLKKAHRSVAQWSLLAVGASLALLFFGMYVGNMRLSNSSVLYYYIVMPLLMACFALTMNRHAGLSLPVRAEWILPICGAVIVGCAILLQLSVYRFCNNTASDGVLAEFAPALFPPAEGLGPWVHRCALILGWASVLLLLIMLGVAGENRRKFPAGENLAWLGLHLAMSFDKLLFAMTDAAALSAALMRNIGILSAEYVAVTALLYAFFRSPGKNNPQKETSFS